MITLIFAPLLLGGALIALAGDAVRPGEPQLDRPTLMALGVNLPVIGDDNYNATVLVRYRRAGTEEWRRALPLHRVRPESVRGWTVEPQFSGSILDLRPATTYEIELRLTDPDGEVDQTFRRCSGQASKRTVCC